MKDYELYARKYPAVVAMLIPAIYTTWMLMEYIPRIISLGNMLTSAIACFVPTAIVYGAIGFFARSLFRDASKMLFQFPLFKEDETEMPTTRLLLWTDKRALSKNELELIAQKVEKDFGIRLLTLKETNKNTMEAKKTIVSAVGKMREVTRKNPNLLQYNIDFGFCRNYLGGSVYSLLALIVLAIVCYCTNIFNYKVILLALAVQVLLSIVMYITLQFKGYTYARALFNVYLSDTQYEW